MSHMRQNTQIKMIRKLERETWIVISGKDIIDIFNEEDAYNKARTKAESCGSRDVFVAKVFCGEGNIESMKKGGRQIPRSIRDYDFGLPQSASWIEPNRRIQQDEFTSVYRTWMESPSRNAGVSNGESPIIGGYDYFRTSVDQINPTPPIQTTGEGILGAAQNIEYSQMTAQTYERTVQQLSEMMGISSSRAGSNTLSQQGHTEPTLGNLDGYIELNQNTNTVNINHSVTPFTQSIIDRIPDDMPGLDLSEL